MTTASSLHLKNAAVTFLVIVPVLLVAIGIASEGGEQPPLGAVQASPIGDVVLERPVQPPIIVLSEAAGYVFETGSAEVSAGFADAIRARLAPRLAEIAAQYRCDTVEVIGHTDGQPINSVSNLDSELGLFVNGDTPALQAGSNADLGLMRAWAVIRSLREQRSLEHLRFYGFSAGQAIDVEGGYAEARDVADWPARRRIEIRVRRFAR